MGIKKDYMDLAVDTILSINPSLDIEKVRSIVAHRVKSSLQDPNIIMENDIKKKKEFVKLSNMCDWIEKEKPIISGNATFYVQPEVLQSPTVIMLKEKKKSRSLIKKEMFEAIKQGEMEKSAMLDLKQNDAKIIVNAEYGASGAPSAAFYNKYTPSATTLMAQAIITILAAFFEGFLGDNQKFYSENECFDWLNIVKRKSSKVDKWISVPSRQETIDRIKHKFLQYSPSYDLAIGGFINNLTDDQLCMVFYANNYKEFIKRNPKISNLLREIFLILPKIEASMEGIPDPYKDTYSTMEEYNQFVSKVMFMNPYSPPDCIKDILSELVDLIKKYCFVEYLTPDSIIKLNDYKRIAVLLVDTDSNVINANLFVEFLKELFNNETFGRKAIYNDIISINTLATILDSCINSLLDFYGRKHNMNEEARKELSMKNEFMFRILFLLEKKKRYISLISLREGIILIPFKTDIKGVDFIKAGVTDKVTNKFTEILQNRILFTDELDLKGLIKDLRDFKQEIHKDLAAGGTDYLKPQTYKPENAYKVKNEKSVAWSLPVFRAVSVWNELNPAQKIYSLDRVKLIKLIVKNPADVDVIKYQYPEIYELIHQKIFNSYNPEIVNAGLKVIAIPSSVKQIPAWILPLIDYQITISDIMSSFSSILDALKIEQPSIKTPSGSAKLLSGLISL